MKNFPHQYNDPSKLRATLITAVDLDAAGQDVAHDGVLGYELARRGIYRFRGLAYPPGGLPTGLEARIRAEVRKDASSQGARTAARDLRRTLILLGFLTAEFELTDLGAEFLDSLPASESERALLRSALVNLRLEGRRGDDVSHPVRILLRLAARQPFLERRGTELALEARDDSPAEWERVQALAALSDRDRLAALQGIQVSRRQIDNARKILPALAAYSGLLEASGTELTLTAFGRAAIEGADEAGPPPELGDRGVVRPRDREFRGAPRRVDRETAARRRGQGDRRELSAQEQLEATRRLTERTDRHQDLVRRIAALPNGGELFEDPVSYDLLMVRADGPIVLWEAKTVDGDEVSQVRAAVGQLFLYRHFYVEPLWPNREVLLAVAFDETISGALTDFLQSLGIGALLIAGNLQPLNELGEEVARLLAD